MSRPMTNEEWQQRVRDRYAEAVALGLHDEHCEYRVEGFYLCHCSKRRREAKGSTEPPADELYFPPPACPRCDADLEHDEGWRCHACRLRWDSAGTDCEFTDVYSEDLAADVAAWESAHAARLARAEEPSDA